MLKMKGMLRDSIVQSRIEKWNRKATLRTRERSTKLKKKKNGSNQIHVANDYNSTRRSVRTGWIPSQLRTNVHRETLSLSRLCNKRDNNGQVLGDDWYAAYTTADTLAYCAIIVFEWRAAPTFRTRGKLAAEARTRTNSMNHFARLCNPRCP